MKTESKICLALLMVVIAWSEINNLIWLGIDTRPPRWDEAHYLNMSLRYSDALTSGGIIRFIKALLTVDPKRPPLVPALAVVPYSVFGRSADAALVVNLVAFACLLVSVYGLGARLASPKVGLLAAFLVATYPGTTALSRVFLLDFCNTTLVAMFLLVLVWCEKFSQRGPSLAVGTVVGLGLLCRAFFPIFVVGPLGVSLYAAWKGQKSDEETRGTNSFCWPINVGLAFLTSAVLIAPWYLRNVIKLTRRSLSAAYGAEAVGYGPTNPLAPVALLSYFIHFVNYLLLPFGLMVCLIALAILLTRQFSVRDSQEDTGEIGYGLWLLCSSLVIPYLFFSTLPGQDWKNVVPLLPAVAVLSAWGLWSLRLSVWRTGLIAVCVVWSLVQFWLETYGLSAFSQQVRVSLGPRLPSLMLVQQATPYGNPFFLLPQKEEWPIPQILTRIGEATRNGEIQNMTQPPTVAVIPDHSLFNMVNFIFYSGLEGWPVQILHPGDPRLPEGRNYQAALYKMDFVVAKTGDPGPDWLTVYNSEIIAFLCMPDSGFREMSPRFALPDGSQAIVYGRRSR